MSDVRQVHLQNALRVLAHKLRPGDTLTYEGNDLFSINGSTPERSQEIAEHLHKRK